MVYKWINNAQKWLFPTHCDLCLAPTHGSQPICPGCYRELPWLAPGCTSCAEPLPTLHPGQCETCLRHPPALDACHALFSYQAPVDQWIRRLKFHQELTLARLLGGMLAEQFRASEDAWLVPVPLHPRRLRQRGFNQALEIARPLQASGYRIEARCVSRTRDTPPQSKLAAKKRRHNLHDAFTLRHNVSGQRIVLIDDVFTTGTTLNTLAATLKRAGATHVEAWTIAKTPEPDLKNLKGSVPFSSGKGY